MSRATLAFGVLTAVTAVVAAQPPTAQPPREVPTQAELIVGDWILTKMDGRPASKTFDLVRSFTPDGKAKSYLRGKNGQIDNLSTGLYRVVGGDIEFASGRPGDQSTRRVPILLLTKTELIIHLPAGEGISRFDYVREKAR